MVIYVSKVLLLGEENEQPVLKKEEEIKNADEM